MTDGLSFPLHRPVGECASRFYDTLLRRGMEPYAMAPEAVLALATPEEWRDYVRMCEVGRERSRAMRAQNAPIPALWNPHSPELWDDPCAADERENPLP